MYSGLCFVFQELKSRGATRSAKDFSISWLGKSSTYYDVCGSNPSSNVLCGLYRMLRKSGHHDLAVRVANELLSEV